jgi:hypothetical protein
MARASASTADAGSPAASRRPGSADTQHLHPNDPTGAAGRAARGPDDDLPTFGGTRAGCRRSALNTNAASSARWARSVSHRNTPVAGTRSVAVSTAARIVVPSSSNSQRRKVRNPPGGLLPGDPRGARAPFGCEEASSLSPLPARVRARARGCRRSAARQRDSSLSRGTRQPGPR